MRQSVFVSEVTEHRGKRCTRRGIVKMQPPPEEVYASIWQDVFMKPASIGPGREKGHAVSLRWHLAVHLTISLP